MLLLLLLLLLSVLLAGGAGVFMIRAWTTRRMSDGVQLRCIPFSALRLDLLFLSPTSPHFISSPSFSVSTNCVTTQWMSKIQLNVTPLAAIPSKTPRGPIVTSIPTIKEAATVVVVAAGIVPG